MHYFFPKRSFFYKKIFFYDSLHAKMNKNPLWFQRLCILYVGSYNKKRQTDIISTTNRNDHDKQNETIDKQQFGKITVKT